MTTKHQPATPLPWTAMDWPRNPRPEDQAFLIHAANAYPRLVEALRDAIKQAEEVWVKASSLGLSKSAGETARKYGNLLRELGEE